MLVDSHVHLDDPRYHSDLPAVLARAQEAGVHTCITIGCDLATSRAAVELANRYSCIYATVGVHPHEASRIESSWYEELTQLARHPKVVAYGEIGLDYHYDHSPRDVQRQCFREQIRLARRLRLPLVVHTREAQNDTVAILREENAHEIGGVFHCFSGDQHLAEQALDLGFDLSFSGIVTFPNATALRDIVRMVPDDRLLVETDAPYLTPVPHRGKRNEPAYVRYVAEKIAELRHGDDPGALARIAHITTENCRRLFKIS
ncbi:MAG: TatD family deoxyribonuclease [Nitrospirae bacterium]|nr:MAG: TatD family deoxyribonuclease [Nitrospirota bacterium]